MATVIVKINTKSKKAKHLLGLISEMSKTDKEITIVEEKTDFMKGVDQSFKELERTKNGKIKPRPARDILNEL